MWGMNNTTTAIVLGTLIKAHIAREIVAMNASEHVVLTGPFKICVYGSTLAELKENRARCFDAAGVFGVGLRAKQTRSGSTTIAVPFENDPFGQTKHYYSELTVTYKEN
jgi:hypothetical protein